MRGMLSIVLLAGGLVLCGHGLALADSKADERRLEAVNLKHDGTSLLKLFRQRTLTDDERSKVKAVIVQLGDDSFKIREHAVAELIARGPVVVELLKKALKDADLEVTRRVERCLQRIKEKDFPPDIPAAAARLVAERKPAGAVEVLLAYLPFAGNDDIVEQIRSTLAALAVRDGKTDRALAAALTDKLPIRRAAAADALCRANVADQKAAVRRLLQDPDPEVRLQVALSLAQAGERDSIPVIIDLLPQLAQVPAWRAEDVLVRLAENRNPPAVSLGNDEASRRKARDAWAAWWKANSAAVDFAKLRQTPPLLGYTVVILLDSGRVMELGKNNEVRWQVDNLLLPLDLQILADDRVLVAEYNARKVTERNRQGEVVWEEQVEGPLVAQRLANGNTFIATDSHVFEVTANHKIVFSQTFPGGERIMKAMKLPNGEVVCLTTEPRSVRVVRMDAQGKELSSFPVAMGQGQRLFGGRIYMLPNGHALVPLNQENKVVEYDVNGKEVWKVTIDQPVAAVRLRNGDTLVTTMGQNRAVEFDRHGNEVWEYRTNTRVTRALRR